MDKTSEFKSRLKAVVGVKPNYPIRGTVSATDGETCIVKLFTGLEVTNVRLKATIGNGNDYLLVTPAIGSDVLMISGNGTLDDLTVIKADHAAKTEIKINGLIVLIDGTDGKVQVKNDHASLVDILSDQAAFLRALKVYTPAGPSGVPLPETISAIDTWEQKFKKLLK